MKTFFKKGINAEAKGKRSTTRAIIKHLFNEVLHKLESRWKSKVIGSEELTRHFIEMTILLIKNGGISVNDRI